MTNDEDYVYSINFTLNQEFDLEYFGKTCKKEQIDIKKKKMRAHFRDLLEGARGVSTFMNFYKYQHLPGPMNCYQRESCFPLRYETPTKKLYEISSDQPRFFTTMNV